MVWALVVQDPSADWQLLTTLAVLAPGQAADSCTVPGATDSLSKNVPFGGNCSTPDQPYMIGTEMNYFENVPLDQKHNSVGTIDDNSADNSCCLNRWVAPAGKGYT